jgi:protein TonB
MAIGATSIRPRSLSLSLALHVAAAIAVVTVSALGPERLPTPLAVAAARGPLLLGATMLRVAPPPLSARPRGVRLSSGRLPRAIEPTQPPTATQAGSPVRTIQEVADPSDLVLGTTGDPCSGCVVGPGDTLEGDPAAIGSGAETVVPIVQGGVVRAPRKVHDATPIYPDLAIRTRLEGHVEIECRIDSAGRVVDAAVLRGPPLLGPAALAAVREWAYEPTLLNGVPVSVIMTVTVHFRLRH